MPRTIVIPIVAGIGNALMAVPMVRLAARCGARVTILARSCAMAEVFRRIDGLEAVIVCGGGARGAARMIAAARRLRPDVYLVPFPSNRWQYSMLAFTSGAKNRVLHGYPVGFLRAMHFLPATRIRARRGLHDVVQNLELLRAIDIAPDLSDSPTFALTGGDRSAADELLGRAGIDGGAAPVIVHAGSARTVLAQAKRWPTANYARLIDALDRRFPGRIVLVEGPDEAGVGDEIADAFARGCPEEPTNTPATMRDSEAVVSRGRATNSAIAPVATGDWDDTDARRRAGNPAVAPAATRDSGNGASTGRAMQSHRAIPAAIIKLAGSLGTAGALLERAALYVGSDSGLGHLAAAVGTPPVTIFGPADPERVCPFGYRALVVSPPRSCGPCFLYPWDAPYPKIRCRPPFCIESITVQSVLDAVDRAMRSSAPAAGAGIAVQPVSSSGASP
jgi:ADP-heptose:LPS heptosyltransferase